MTNEYISFEGRRLRVHRYKSQIFAIDRDVAGFFGVTLKYLKFITNINKKYMTSGSSQKVTRDIFEYIKKCDNSIEKSYYVYSFEGIIELAFKINRSDIAARLSVWVIRTLTKECKLDMFELLRNMAAESKD
ncbi:MAG: hypothetical protein ABIF11_05990 [Nitrospirota bacterium]